MKKTLLLAVATVMAMTTSAQTKSEMAHNAHAVPAQIVPELVTESETLHLLTADEVRAQAKVAPKANVKAWYNRPTGTMWQTYITTDGTPFFQASIAPFLHVNPWKDVTFESASTNATTQEWKVFHRKEPTTFTEPSVTSQWGCQTDTIPVLTARDSQGNSSTYTPQAYNFKTGSAVKYASFINAFTNYTNQYRPGNTQHFWSSPKFFGSDSNRDGTKTQGAFTASVKDYFGQPAGKLMGKNNLGINGMAIAAEAPLHPYIINRVGLRYQSLQLADDVTIPMTATIYKLESVPAYTSDGMPVIMDVPSEVLATVTINVNNTWLKNQREQYKTSDGYNGIMPFTLSTPLEVNSAILVCIEGYNVDEMNDNFTSVYSSDYYDEGHGEIGYIKTISATGSTIFMGLRGGFVSVDRYTAPAVLLDEERRFLEFNKNDETGHWNAPVEGGDSIINLFSYLPTTQINVKVTELDKNGTAINNATAPTWLTYTLKDQLMPDGTPSLSGIIHFNVKVEPNAAQERAAQVEMSFSGAKLVYTVKQDGTTIDIKGDVNGDGNVDVDDVNEIINLILSGTKNPKGDINNDGNVDVDDVNAVINIILGI